MFAKRDAPRRIRHSSQEGCKLCVNYCKALAPLLASYTSIFLCGEVSRGRKISH